MLRYGVERADPPQIRPPRAPPTQLFGWKLALKIFSPRAASPGGASAKLAMMEGLSVDRVESLGCELKTKAQAITKRSWCHGRTIKGCAHAAVAQARLAVVAQARSRRRRQSNRSNHHQPRKPPKLA